MVRSIRRSHHSVQLEDHRHRPVRSDSHGAGRSTKTDVYGAPGTTYPTGYNNPNNNRGIIGKTNQFFTITNGGTELEVNLTANFDGFKELRVFTSGSATGVPEPASIAIWSLAGTFFAGRGWWRRRQR